MFKQQSNLHWGVLLTKSEHKKKDKKKVQQKRAQNNSIKNFFKNLATKNSNFKATEFKKFS
jgi:hypothetical protein